MIRIQLTEEKKKQLEHYRGQASSKNSEKALMAIKSSEGKSPKEIAEILKRNPHTIRKWLKRYQKEGIRGLDRLYSPGRPNHLRNKVKNIIEEILEKSPADFGYQDGLWTVTLIVHYLKNQRGVDVSEDTVERSLKDMRYTYKRPKISVSEKAPSEEEKLEAVRKIVDEIMELIQKKDCVIVALDESHFSNEPYRVRGWQKKRWPPEDILSCKKGKNHILWLLESPDKKILLEKI